MPPPTAAIGLIVGTSVAIAGLIAAYESPLVRMLIRKGRKRLSEWLHALGDEISPEERRKILELHDISMMEEKGEEAERRRQAAREEIVQRATILERRRSKFAAAPSASSVLNPCPATSFDGLVDKNGQLIPRAYHQKDTTYGGVESSTAAVSTGIDLSGAIEEVQQQEILERSAPFAVLPATTPSVNRMITDPFSDLAIVHEVHSPSEATAESETAAADRNREQESEDEHEPSGFLTPKTATPPGSVPTTPRNRDHAPNPRVMELPINNPFADFSTTIVDSNARTTDHATAKGLKEQEQQGDFADHHQQIQNNGDSSGNCNGNDTDIAPRTETPRSPSVLSHPGTDMVSMTDTSADMLSDLESMRGGQVTPEWSEVSSIGSVDDHHFEQAHNAHAS
ncbi:hypothetical protein KEM54_006143 [Ascosphaera aggregata]|nr:hypothetical protein KEM54_006143 [Ascosphaera aggregata]